MDAEQTRAIQHVEQQVNWSSEAKEEEEEHQCPAIRNNDTNNNKKKKTNPFSRKKPIRRQKTMANSIGQQYQDQHRDLDLDLDRNQWQPQQQQQINNETKITLNKRKKNQIVGGHAHHSISGLLLRPILKWLPIYLLITTNNNWWPLTGKNSPSSSSSSSSSSLKKTSTTTTTATNILQHSHNQDDEDRNNFFNFLGQVKCDDEQQQQQHQHQQQFDDHINFDVINADFDDNNNQQQQQQQQQQQPSPEQIRRQKSIMSYFVSDPDQETNRLQSSSSGVSQLDSNNNQQFGMSNHDGDLLESQSNADSNTGSVATRTVFDSSSTPSVSVSGSGSGSSSSLASSEQSATAKQVDQSAKSSGVSSGGSSGGGSISDQLNAVVNLLQQMGINQQQQQQQQQHSQQLQQQQQTSQVSTSAANAITDAIATSVTNSILNPIRSQTAAVGNIVRQTITGQRAPSSQQAGNQQSGTSAGAGTTVAATNNNQPQLQRPSQIIVGQNQRPTIDGGIEYNPDSNTLDGFFEFPNLNFFNRSSKPSLQSLKPYLLAGLKTVPLKVGAVGWKLLQLLAWKKIYKTHHPKQPTELVIEEEISSSKSSHTKSPKGGKEIIDIHHHSMGPKSMMGKTSKMGHMYSGMQTDNDAGWPTSGMMMQPSGSSQYQQRHTLLSGAGPAPNLGMQQQQHHSHPATAAAAAAAATAAAIQSQWVQQQLANELAAVGFSNTQISSDPLGPLSSEQQSSSKSSSSGSSSSANSTQSSSSANLPSSALARKRTTRSGFTNWFASPAQAYATAASNAAAFAQHQHQQQQQQHSQNLGWPLFNFATGEQQQQQQQQQQEPTFQRALAGLMYQNLFDNAAAMAVQSAVKLPQMSDFMDPTSSGNNYAGSLDSSGSSSSSSSSSSLASSLSASAGAAGQDEANDVWSQLTLTGSGAHLGSGAGNFLEGRSDSPSLSQQQQQQQQQYINSDSQNVEDNAIVDEFGGHSSSGAIAFQRQQQQQQEVQQQPSSPVGGSSMADFDDTPAGRYLSSALQAGDSNSSTFYGNSQAILK